MSAAAAASAGEKRSFVDEVEEQQLVLDVEGTRVFLAKKETGKRSQGGYSTALRLPSLRHMRLFTCGEASRSMDDNWPSLTKLKKGHGGI